MYVNTLITLQENLTTYAVAGKKVTGHVTINSPGMIKCYIQNLKGQESESMTYSFYAFSKVMNKAVRIGNLSKHKETRWLVDETNIEGSGIKLEDLDAVAVVMENSMRGADTVAMGFKNNRYIIIPLIDEAIKKLPWMKDKQADKNESSKKEQAIEKKTEKSSIQNIDSEKKQKSYVVTKENKPMVKSEATHEVSHPVGITKNTSDSSSMKLNSYESSKPQSGSMNTSMGVANNKADEKMLADDLKPDQGMDITISNMQVQGSIASQESIESKGNTASQDSMKSQESTASQENIQYQGNNNNTVVEIQSSGESDFIKGQLSAKSEFCETMPMDNLSDEELQLMKIAKKLQEVDREPTIKKVEEADNPVSLNNTSSDSKAREEEDSIDEALQKTSEELRSIIERLNGDMQIKEKIESIERQIEKISELSRDQKATDKPRLEQTIEKQYLGKQDQANHERRNIVGISEQNEIEDVTQQVQEDTSPQNALNFIKDSMNKFPPVKPQEKASENKSLLNEQRRVEEEVDYISKIDQKIREIEERRKMGKE